VHSFGNGAEHHFTFEEFFCYETGVDPIFEPDHHVLNNESVLWKFGLFVF